jgi:hypothetical protein
VTNSPEEPVPLVVEAMRKASVAWLAELPGRPPERASTVWCAWLDGALYVVSGPGEQPVPGLAEAQRCTVTARGDSGGRIVTWPATVGRVEPGGEEWERVVPQLAAKRLNLPANEDTGARWAAECLVSRLTPAGAPAPLPDGSLAAPATESPAARRTATPFHLHRTPRRR